MLEDSSSQSQLSVAKLVAVIAGAVLIAAGGIGYAVHEHHSAQVMAAQKQTLAAQNDQMSAQLALTRTQLNQLEAKVNTFAPAGSATPNQAKPAPENPAGGTAAGHHVITRRSIAQDPRFKKFESQLDAQGKAIDQTRSDLASARTELGGSIARTHDELVVLEKKGEHNYIEFDIAKTKQFKREGPIGIRLSKANTKHQYADLMLMVDDRNLTQKHVNLYQPAMFYEPDSPQPIEIVINDISKDHIHGYVSAPKYRKSELDAMTNPGSAGAAQGDKGIVGDSSAAGSNQAANGPALRKRLPLPGNAADQQ
jgi:hypothetical protein